MPFVKLVEDDGADAIERAVGEEPARQYAFGEKAQTRARTADFFKADLVADGFADALAEFSGDVTRGKASGEAARFQYEDFAIGKIKQGRRNTGSLPCPRRRFENQVGMGAQVLKNLRHQRIDGKMHASSSWHGVSICS